MEEQATDSVELLVGVDDTDMLDTPGTNKLARHLIDLLADIAHGGMITRHQLLMHPKVPCTRKNGCAAVSLKLHPRADYDSMIARMRQAIIDWCPEGSDPGLAVATTPVSHEIVEYGLACQTRVVTQDEARKLAAKHGIFLEGLGGTEDGVIGALAAIGLRQTRNDGRVVYLYRDGKDQCEIVGVHAHDTIFNCGVDEIRRVDVEAMVATGTIVLGKRLRPNFRDGKVVLFVRQFEDYQDVYVTEKIA